jgi:hypothetical protein
LFQATVTSLAIFIDCDEPKNDEPVRHIIAKRTKQSKERFYFEFDHYDFYDIPKKLVADNINIWKCNLLGGYRVCDIIENFNKIKADRLSDFYKNNNISIHGKIKKEDIFSIQDKKANDYSLFKEKNPIPQKDIYWGIKKSILKGSFPEEITIDYFANKNKIDALGFSGSVENIKSLKNYIKENSELISFYIAATSGRQGIRSPYVFDTFDFDSFPYCDKLLDYFTDNEKIVISDVVNYTLDEFGNGEKALINTNATKKDIESFADTYCGVLNTVYQSDVVKYVLTNIIEGDAWFVCEMQYNSENTSYVYNKEHLSLSSLLSSKNISQTAKINKIVRFYGENVILIAKPKQLRFWLKSKALRDADETFNDILSN